MRCGPGADLGIFAMKLADKIIATLPAPSSGNQRFPDDDGRGLAVQVSAAGHRAFVLRYRVQGKERQLTIGACVNWNVTAARHRARELRRQIDQGIDPLAQEAAALAEAMTVAEFWRIVYEPLHVVTKRPSWQRDIRSMMARDILPTLGKRAIKEIDHADISALHRQIGKRAPARANRVLSVLSHLLGFSERPHILETGERIPALRPGFSNPCRGISRNHEEARQRYLTPDEMTRLAGVLERHPERVTVALVRFLLLTGARFGEAAGATWDQFDLERGVWRKPSAHTKQKREHIVPISAPAVALLHELRVGRNTGDCLFPGVAGKPITTVKTFWRSVTRQAGIEGVRVHDLRHSFASTLASGGASLLLMGQLLGHTQASTTKRYAHLADAAQREAVERAAAVIAGQPSAEIVRLRRAR
jgi:integrase